METKRQEKIKAFVLDKYRDVARQGSSSDHTASSCQGCCGSREHSFTDIATTLGYSPEELAVAPEGANLGLGCGNPQTIADLQPG